MIQGRLELKKFPEGQNPAADQTKTPGAEITESRKKPENSENQRAKAEDMKNQAAVYHQGTDRKRKAYQSQAQEKKTDMTEKKEAPVKRLRLKLTKRKTRPENQTLIERRGNRADEQRSA